MYAETLQETVCLNSVGVVGNTFSRADSATKWCV